MKFRKLTLHAGDIQRFRDWARKEYKPFSAINGLWHPVVQDECVRMNTEAAVWSEAQPWAPAPAIRWMVTGTAHYAAGFDYEIEATTREAAERLAKARVEAASLEPDLQEVCVQEVGRLSGPVTTGTSHFVSFETACTYYAPYGFDEAAVRAKLEAGEIHLGEPPLPPGGRLVRLDDGLRWGIEQ